MDNRLLVLEMSNKYNTISYDWMGYSINKKNRLTYHHIVKKCDGGEESIYNGALLGRISHNLLHSLEQTNPFIYEKWNELFTKINVLGQIDENVFLEILDLKIFMEDILENENIKSQNQRKRVLEA